MFLGSLKSLSYYHNESVAIIQEATGMASVSLQIYSWIIETMGKGKQSPGNKKYTRKEEGTEERYEQQKLERWG